MSLHKAEPATEGAFVCEHCDQPIKHLPAGQGWVHEDGYKLGYTEAEYKFTVTTRFIAGSRQEAWDMWVEWLTEPMNLESATFVEVEK